MASLSTDQRSIRRTTRRTRRPLRRPSAGRSPSVRGRSPLSPAASRAGPRSTFVSSTATASRAAGSVTGTVSVGAPPPETSGPGSGEDSEVHRRLLAGASGADPRPLAGDTCRGGRFGPVVVASGAVLPGGFPDPGAAGGTAPVYEAPQPRRSSPKDSSNRWDHRRCEVVRTRPTPRLPTVLAGSAPNGGKGSGGEARLPACSGDGMVATPHHLHLHVKVVLHEAHQLGTVGMSGFLRASATFLGPGQGRCISSGLRRGPVRSGDRDPDDSDADHRGQEKRHGQNRGHLTRLCSPPWWACIATPIERARTAGNVLVEGHGGLHLPDRCRRSVTRDLGLGGRMCTSRSTRRSGPIGPKLSRPGRRR